MWTEYDFACKCHVCGREFVLREEHLDAELWTLRDGRTVNLHSCGRHAREESRAVWESGRYCDDTGGDPASCEPLTPPVNLDIARAFKFHPREAPMSRTASRVTTLVALAVAAAIVGYLAVQYVPDVAPDVARRVWMFVRHVWLTVGEWVGIRP